MMSSREACGITPRRRHMDHAPAPNQLPNIEVMRLAPKGKETERALVMGSWLALDSYAARLLLGVKVSRLRVLAVYNSALRCASAIIPLPDGLNFTPIDAPGWGLVLARVYKKVN